MSNRGDDVKVGITVVTAVVLLFITIISVSGNNPFRTQQKLYKARFNFVGGLTQGSTVRLGGLTVGRVEGMHILQDQEAIIEIELSVKPDTPVRKDSEALITSLGFLGDNYVEITLGSPQSPFLPAGEYLKNRQTPAISDIFAKVDSTMVDAQKLVKDLNLQINDISEKAKKLITDVDTTFREENQRKITSILNEIDALIKDSSPKVSDTLANLKNASTRIEPLLDNVNGTIKKVDQLVLNVDGVVTESRPEFKKVLLDLDQALLDARNTILELKSMLQYNRGNLDILIENLAASSDNIREFTNTVKQNPSSLIRTPSAKPRVPPEIQK